MRSRQLQGHVIASFGVLLGLLVVTSSGCTSKEEEASWFPLSEGRSWTYQKTWVHAGESRVSRYSIETKQLNAEEKNQIAAQVGEEASRIALRQTSSGTRYYLASNEEGIFRVAKQVLIEKQPRFDPVPKMVLPSEVDLDVGATWEVETQPFALASTAAHIPWLPEANRFGLMYEIVDMDATVETVAGTFQHCIQVQGQAQISFYADPRLGYQDLLIQQTEWYAKGVGLVKLVRDEPLDLEMYQGGQVILELISYQ